MCYNFKRRYLNINNNIITEYLKKRGCSHITFINRGCYIVAKTPPVNQLTLNKSYCKIRFTKKGISTHIPCTLEGVNIFGMGISDTPEDGEVFRFYITNNDRDIYISKNSIIIDKSFFIKNDIDISDKMYVYVSPLLYDYYKLYNMIIFNIDDYNDRRSGQVIKKLTFDSKKNKFISRKIFDKINGFSKNCTRLDNMVYNGYTRQDDKIFISFKEK